jgi:hypothetical protein
MNTIRNAQWSASSAGEQSSDRAQGDDASTARLLAGSALTVNATKSAFGAASIQIQTKMSTSLAFSTRPLNRTAGGDAQTHRRQPAGCQRKRVNSKQ